ncbi:MAG: VCBS repeat-containing protein [candidate division Zixibacteria bacterium]|nr:VCBS repeat-containing protein [candidate division Zixibacteria bacterium]
MPLRSIIIKLIFSTLIVVCFSSFSHADVWNEYNPYDFDIPDYPNGYVYSDLLSYGAPDGAYITNVRIYYEFEHTDPSQLNIWLTTLYDNHWHDFPLYYQGDLPSDPDLRHEARNNMHLWDGASPNQEWFLCIRDNVSGDVGSIYFFELWITYDYNHEPNPPYNEEPEDNETDISITTNLDWSCNDPDGDVLYYTVYFEENSSPDNIIKDDETGSNADPGLLDYDSHYYWKVEVSDHNGGISEGPVWDFYTEPEPIINAEILNVTFDKIEVIRGLESITSTILLRNTGNQTWTFYIGGSSILNGGTEWYDWLPLRAPITLNPNQSGAVELSWEPGFDIPLGFYGFYCKVFMYSTGDDYFDENWSEGAFQVIEGSIDVSLTSVNFESERIRKSETIYATIELYNNSPDPLNNVHFYIDFLSPLNEFVGGVDSYSFDIPGLSSYTTVLLPLWTVHQSDYSGAYDTRIWLQNSQNDILAEFTSNEYPEIPLLAVGDFPILNNIIVKSQFNFSFSDPSSVQTVLQEFSDRNINSISMNIKLDDGEGQWPSVIRGQVLFNSVIATTHAQNPLSYDLYSQAQTDGQNIGININPWFPTFSDSAQSMFDHPQWRLLPEADPAEPEYFIDADSINAHIYINNLISEAIQSPYFTPNRLTIDHFRFTAGQHGPSSITAFVEGVRTVLPSEVELAGYVFPPSDSNWSGQDYQQLNPYLDVFSPMLYWQARWLQNFDDIPFAARQKVLGHISDIKSILGDNTTEQKVMPTVGISTTLISEDLSDTVSLEYNEWKKTQLNVLGIIADEGLSSFDLFYWGNWLWLVDQDVPELGRWIDWAEYLANLSREFGSLQVMIEPDKANDAGAQWRRIGTTTWRNSGFIEQGIPVGTYIVEFRPITGWNESSDQQVIINNNETTSINATYIRQTGSLQVMIFPQEAVNDGAQWRRVGTTTWQNSGYIEQAIPIGQYSVEFKPIADWYTPDNIVVTINSDGLTEITGIYESQLGSLQITIFPQGAIDDGAQWQVDGGEWHESDYIQSGLLEGEHIVEFSSILDWITPPNQTITVNGGELTTAAGVYEPEFVDRTMWYVDDDNTSGPWNGTLEYPFSMIQEGIDSAASGDTVFVQQGTYIENISFEGKGIFLTSSFIFSEDTLDIHNTVIDGDSTGSVIVFQNGEDSLSVINGFTIQNGNAYNGAGIYCHNYASPKILNNTIKNNHATGSTSQGGGIACLFYSTPFICRNIITLNTANSGGGISSFINSSPEILENTIIDNLAFSNGGGIFSGGSDSIGSNIIVGNAANYGGGISVFGTPIITGNYIYSNSSNQGGGIRLANGTAYISRNVIFNNIVDGSGGGVAFINNSNAYLNNNTIYGNSATTIGGGVLCSMSNAEIVNLICWNNNANIGNEIYHVSSTLSVVYSNIEGGWVGIGNINTDPYFIDPLNNDFNLHIESPCIDIAHPDSLDPDGTQADMGALYFDQSNNHIPLEFLLVSPIDEDVVNSDSVELTWNSSLDLDGNNITYWIYWTLDPDFGWHDSISTADTTYILDNINRLVLESSNLSKTGIVSKNSLNDKNDEKSHNPTKQNKNQIYQPQFDPKSNNAIPMKETYVQDEDYGSQSRDLPDDTIIFWKIRSEDALGFYKWCTPREGWSFSVYINDSPLPFDLLSPTESDTSWDLTASLLWESSFDPDPNDEITYSIYYDTLSNLSTAFVIENISDTSFTISSLFYDHRYYWTIKAEDTNTDGTWASDSLSFYTHLPSQLFRPAVNYGSWNNPGNIISIDLDNDSDNDLAVTNGSSSTISILFNHDCGLFDSISYFNTATYPQSIASADLNSDNYIDLAVASYYSQVSIHFNDGYGSFDSVAFFEVGENPNSICLADFDGDNDIDLATANGNTNNVSVLFNNGEGQFESGSSYNAGLFPQAICSADLNDDTFIDLAVANQHSANITIFLNYGDGTFYSTPLSPSVGYRPWSICSIDFDNDNNNDLAVANFGSDNISILINNGDGTFESAANYSVGDGPESVYSADFNGDYYKDLAVVNTFSNNVLILLNDGEGLFEPEGNYSIGRFPKSVFSIDLDGDGDFDLATANLLSDNISILINLSEGNYPSSFDLILPVDLDTVWNLNTELYWHNSVDPDPYDSVLYEVYYDTLANFSTAIVFQDITDTSFSISSLIDDKQYFWTVKAKDTNTSGTWADDTLAFSTYFPESPVFFTLASPPDEDTLDVSEVTVSWHPSSDSDPGDSLYYRVYWSENPQFVNAWIDSTSDTSYVITDLWSLLFYDTGRSSKLSGKRIGGLLLDLLDDVTLYWKTGRSSKLSGKKTGGLLLDLPDDVTLYWKVEAVDRFNNTTWCEPEAGWSFNVYLNDAPGSFSLVSPIDEDTVWLLETELVWHESENLDPGDSIWYEVYYDTLADLSTADTVYVVIDTSAVVINLIDDYQYWWTVKAKDTNTDGTMASNTFSFYTYLPETPIPFSLIYPTIWDNLDSSNIVLVRWQASEDPDPLDSISYEINFNFLDSMVVQPESLWENSNIIYARTNICSADLNINVGDTASWWIRAISLPDSIESNERYRFIWPYDCLVGLNYMDIIIPDSYFLAQNHPNPFNPITNIEYGIPKESFIKISIYDILGREIDVIVNQYQQAGYFKVIWDASGLPSGLYFYKIQAGRYSKIRKMLLLK